MPKFAAGKFILARKPMRFEGTAANAHAAPKADLTRRARVGYCPCCTRATYSATPPRCELGEFSWFKELRLALGMAHDPWAPRRLMARKFAKDPG